jgi:hypothetical protein
MKTQQELEHIYDGLYDQASKVLAEINPCQHTVSAGKHTCTGKDTVNWDLKPQHRNTPQCCCVGCKYWDYGCKAEKPLACKVWLCSAAMYKFPKAIEALNAIGREAKRFALLSFRSDKTTSIKNALTIQEKVKKGELHFPPSKHPGLYQAETITSLCGGDEELARTRKHFK